MFHRCLSRLAAALAACLILFLSLPAVHHASGAGNILRAAEGGAVSTTCGADWEHPCDLRYAMMNRAKLGDEVWVKAGTYYPTTDPTYRSASFVLRGGISVYGGFAGTETERNQRNWEVNRTILSGDIDHNDLASPAETADQIQGANSLHVVSSSNVVVDAVLDGFIITAGQAINGPDNNSSGGGVKIFSSVIPPPGSGGVHISNVHITGNRAGFGGGAFISDNCGVLSDALISGNAAVQGGGAAIAFGSQILRDVIFTGNTATYQGGGLYADYPDMPISGALFANNYAGADGGGVYFRRAKPQISGTTFENNRADGNGGAIYNDEGILTLRDGLMTGNSALNGGAMYSYENIATLTNVTVTGNTASGQGGGFYMISADPASAQVTKHLTVAYNTAAKDGGLYVTGTKLPEIYNSILWGNSDATTIKKQITGTAAVRNSVIEGGYAGGVNIRSSNPYLAALSDLGGPVRVRPLLPGSPAADFADAAYCPDADARGVARPQGTGCDVGAYESRPFQVTVLAGDGQSAPVYRYYPQPLEVSVTSAYGEPVNGGRLSISYLAGKFTYDSTALTISSGKVSIWARAGTMEGSHTVWFLPSPATVPGDPGTAAFNLTNTVSEPAVFRVALTNSSGLCGDRWDRPCNLDHARILSIPGDEIWVKAGTYRGSSDRPIDLPKGVEIYGGFAGTETTRDARDWEANLTILSGDSDRNDLASPITHPEQMQGRNSTSVVYWQSCGYVTLDGFTITGARSQSGIFIRSCDATLRNLVIQGNMSDQGGGIYADQSTLLLDNVILRYNHASEEGGGLWTRGSDRFRMENSIFEGNTAGYDGGGARISGLDNQMKNVAFLGNVAGGLGGGLIFDGSEFELYGAVFHQNQAAMGGGLYIDSGPPNLDVENVTFSENSATVSGGAMMLEYRSHNYSCAFRHLTMVGNAAPSGGGVYVDSGSHEMCSSILWNNTVDQVFEYQGSIGIANSIIEGGYEGPVNSSADPLLAPLGNYGGGTQTFALLPGSPAIGGAQYGYCSGVDQRGVTRPQGVGCDMGAFESRGFTLTVTDGATQSTLITQPFVNPLAVLVHSAANEPVEGGLVTFTPPVQGASAVISGSPARITSQRAAVTAQANDIAGSYEVIARGPGIEPAIFHLLNLSAPATVQASILKSPVVYGEPLSLRAQVQADMGTLTGKVQFRLDDTEIGGPVDLVGGEAALEADDLIPAGAHQLTAVYLGDANHQAASTDMPIPLTIEQASTSVAIISFDNPAIPDQIVDVAALIRIGSPGRGQPTGSVIFTVDDGQEVSRPVDNGEADLRIEALPLGRHSITAKYTGDANFSASPTADFTQWVENLSPTLLAIEPEGVFEDGPAFTLTITGENFAPGAVIRWNTVDVSTVWVDSSTLRAEIPPEWIEEPREVQITVFNPEPGGGESGAVVFRVYERLRVYLPVVVRE